ncbi:sulfite exporter TauE/SafE family protein [Microbulbifer epialgicus]|uniref:Probable membrane transporter protein n=1 Tax=Microbulbifer epialgicus TaxID=393907 RepID=A0ABV4P401_9GAMM
MAIELILIGLLLILVAGVIHGALGFGFPMLATPILALAYGLKTAVILTMIPSLLIIITSLYNCRSYKIDIKKYGLIIAIISLGSLSGAWLLTWVNPDVLKLLLAGSILVYLLSGSINKYLAALSRKPHLFAVLIGPLAGLIGGATNAVAPVLMIYLLRMTQSKQEIIFVSNACFLIGKLMQLAILSLYLTYDELELLPLSMITIVAYLGLVAGLSVQSRIDNDRYRSIIRYALSLFMCMLIYQGMANLVFVESRVV